MTADVIGLKQAQAQGVMDPRADLVTLIGGSNAHEDRTQTLAKTYLDTHNRALLSDVEHGDAMLAATELEAKAARRSPGGGRA